MKLFLAGILTCEKDKEENNIRYALETFFTLKNKNENNLTIQRIKNNVFDLFLLDSGAFTFMNSSKGSINWDKYINDYANFINKYNIKYFFELDIDSIVGIEEVERLRNILENKTNKKCIPVWHKSRGLEYWKKMTKEYDYVAIGGIVTKEIKKDEYKYFKPLLEIAKKNNCKVHGLGFTNLKELKKYDFYSVDSTSWLSGGRFGTIYNFKNGTLEQFSPPKGMRGGQYTITHNHNMKEWVKFQKYLDNKQLYENQPTIKKLGEMKDEKNK